MENPWVLRAVSLLGIGVLLGVAWLCAEDRHRPPWRLIAWGLGLQFALGALVLRTGFGQWFFLGVKRAFDVVTDASGAGADFVFGNLSRVFVLERVLVPGPGGLEPVDHFAVSAVLAFKVLPVIIFVSGLSAILQHLGVIQAVVRAMAWVMRRTLRTTGVETFSAALLVFLGIESISAVGAYLRAMSRSEIFVIMVAFLATIAASVMVAYAGFGAQPGHLLAASIMSAPAALVVAKLIVPATRDAAAGPDRVEIAAETHNVFDAAARGGAVGLNMALNVGAMLIVFVGLVYLADLATVAATGQPLTTLLGYVFRPFALVMGIPPRDVAVVAELLATKSVFNEFLAYQQFQGHLSGEDALHPRSATIATYALCGFANPGSLGILIGGLSGLCPERRAEIAGLTLRAYLGGTLAAFLTACVAGVLT